MKPFDLITPTLTLPRQKGEGIIGFSEVVGQPVYPRPQGLEYRINHSTQVEIIGLTIKYDNP
jgi:hypothetical protein